jgi:hypothetical protein
LYSAANFSKECVLLHFSHFHVCRHCFRFPKRRSSFSSIVIVVVAAIVDGVGVLLFLHPGDDLLRRIEDAVGLGAASVAPLETI